MGVGDTFHMAPVGVFFGDGEDARRHGRRPRPATAGRRPVLRRRGPVPQGVHRVRRVHDGLPARREEHPQRELPLPRGEGRRGGPPDDDGRLGDRATRGAATRSRPLPDRPQGRSAGRLFTARRVVVAAGTYGTQTLLHRMKDQRPTARTSPTRLGELTRTNSEALVGAQTDDRRYRKRHGAPRVDFTRGVAITSSIHPDENTHIEPVRYGKGSNAMGSCRSSRCRTAPTRVRSLARAARPGTPRSWLVRSPTTAGPSGPSSAWSCSRSTTP